MQTNLKNNTEFNPGILFAISFLIFCCLYAFFDFPSDDIIFILALAKFSLLFVFGAFFLYLFICYIFVYTRMKIRENTSRKKAKIHEEEKRIKDEKYREWYKEHYDDY